MPGSDTEDKNLSPEFRLSLFRQMLRLRLIEEAIVEQYGEQEMRCPVHLSVGQEAAAVGSAAALEANDRIVSTHRGHAHYLAKGGNLTAMLAEMYGRETGCSRGRGGSMNLIDLDAGVMATLPIVATSIPLGVGLALAEKQLGTDGVIGIYFGDAAIEEGAFHEAANFAALRNLPAVFLCENNLYSVYTKLAERQPERPLTEVAQAHGMPSRHEDGNDVEAVYLATSQAARRARAGDGPSFLLFDTYRWREHCGPNYDNDLGYRTVDEFETWQIHCPLKIHRARLAEAGLLAPNAEATMTVEIKGEIGAAFASAKAAPFPRAEQAGDNVYG